MRGKAKGRLELLRKVSLFSECSNRELSRIGSLTSEIRVPAGEVLVREGRPGREFFVIADGKAKATIRRKRVAALGPGGFFGEMALFDSAPRSATVTAETAMRLLVLDPRSFVTLVETTPSVVWKILRVLAQRLRVAEKAPTH